jgi:hypothetical protein
LIWILDVSLSSSFGQIMASKILTPVLLPW